MKITMQCSKCEREVEDWYEYDAWNICGDCREKLGKLGRERMEQGLANAYLNEK